MRVHSTEEKKSGGNRYTPVIVFLLVAILATNLFRGGESKPDASAAVDVPKKTVLVAKTLLKAGEAVAKEAVADESRPLSTLPADAVVKLEELQGKVPVGPIPAGYPLAKALFVDQKVAAAAKGGENAIPTENIEMLERIRAETVALSITFTSPAPKKGTRIALSIQGKKGKPALVADEAWVDTNSGNSAQVRVRPEIALFLEEVKPLGTFSYFDIGIDGSSPYKGTAIHDMALLRERLQLVEERAPTSVRVTSTASPEQKHSISFTSFAWSRDKRIKYGIDAQGKMYVIEKNGSAVPLHQYNMELEPDSEAAPVIPEQSAEPVQDVSVEIDSGYQESSAAPSREVKSGLERLAPLVEKLPNS